MTIAENDDRPIRAVAWGFVSQAASSISNFGLSLLAGLAVGPRGLGVIYVGFAYYLFAVLLQRSLITEPLVARSSADRGASDMAGPGLVATLIWACATTGLLAAGGGLIGGDVGAGLLLFAPWLIPALVQDFWRAVLFRDGRGSAAALNDAVWVIVMALSVPLALVTHDRWAVVACWGAGAAAGAVLGFVQVTVRPGTVRDAARWWRSTAWPIGKWLGAESVVYGIGSLGLVFALVYVVGSEALGGLRAVQSVFGPLSLVGPALALPALPYLSRLAPTSPRKARTAAVWLGAVGGLITGAYLVVASLRGGRLLTFVFGDTFASFRELIWPVGIGQTIVAATVGFTVLLKARSEGRPLLAARSLSSIATFGFGLALAYTHAILGAAWGITIGYVAWSGAVAAFALRRGRPSPQPAPGDQQLAPAQM